MHTSLFEILRKNKQLVAAIIGIVCVLFVPIPTPTVSREENPNDSFALPLSSQTPLHIQVDSIPPKTSAIALWAGDSIKAPFSTVLSIQQEGHEPNRFLLQDIMSEERKILIPIDATHSNTLNILLSAPSLPPQKALLLRTQEGNTKTLAYTLYEKKPFVLSLLRTLYDHNAIADDIEYVWREGAAIVKGENPYEKSLSSEHRDNKYATYFPLSYIVSAGIYASGFESFDSWLSVVRPLVLMAQLATAFFVLFFLYSKHKLALGVASFFIILLHRFTLYPARVYHIDFPAIMFLILGIMLISRRIKTGYLLIGISLAIKQVAIILVPVFLLWEWQQHRSIQKTLISLLLMMAIPVLSILPFTISSPEGVLTSLAFSTNRTAGGDFATPEIATLLSLPGSFTRIIMYALIAIIYLAFWRKELALFGASLAILTIFLGFNPVLFFQYLAWIIPFIPLAVAEINKKITEET